MAATLTTAALRHSHIRTNHGRACPCCASIRNGSDSRKLRRMQRRRENQALRNTPREEL